MWPESTRLPPSSGLGPNFGDVLSERNRKSGFLSMLKAVMHIAILWQHISIIWIKENRLWNQELTRCIPCAQDRPIAV